MHLLNKVGTLIPHFHQENQMNILSVKYNVMTGGGGALLQTQGEPPPPLVNPPSNYSFDASRRESWKFNELMESSTWFLDYNFSSYLNFLL